MMNKLFSILALILFVVALIEKIVYDADVTVLVCMGFVCVAATVILGRQKR